MSVPLNGKQFEATVSHVTFAITAAIGLVLLYRTRFENLPRQLGLLLVGIAIGGPAAWPWYFTWGLALLACRPAVQRSFWIPLAIVVPAFIISPNGQLALTLSLSPYILVLYLVLLSIAGRHWWTRRGAVPRSHGGTASVLAHR